IGRPNSIGVSILGSGSSGSRIRLCEFTHLGTGISAVDSGVPLSDNAFESINANGSASRAIAYFTTIAKSGETGVTPVLGDRERIIGTGFNRFRNLATGALAIEFTDPTATAVEVLSAQYNDWGVYSESAIRALVGGLPDELLDTSSSIPESKAFNTGNIVGYV